jgi:hypothetical protein
MISDNNSSPIAISIVKIISKSVDLLINGDNIISTTGVCFNRRSVDSKEMGIENS